MNKFFWGLIAVSLSLAACQNGKNTTKSSPIPSIPEKQLPKEEVGYYDNEKTNQLLTNNTWEVVAFVYPHGNSVNYDRLKTYNFKERSVKFTDNFPNDCNTCSAAADYDFSKQLISVKKGSSRPCTELDCGVSSAIEENVIYTPQVAFNVILEENMGYKIRTDSTLELYISKGHYKFRIHSSLREQNLTNLDNTNWEIIAYRDLQNAPNEKFKPLKRNLLISFNPSGYSYSPTCNRCSFTLKDFSTKNGVINWDTTAEANNICTLLGCLNDKSELPGAIVSNGMTYVIEDDYLYLTNDKFKLKLKPYKLK